MGSAIHGFKIQMDIRPFMYMPLWDILLIFYMTLLKFILYFIMSCCILGRWPLFTIKSWIWTWIQLSNFAYGLNIQDFKCRWTCLSLSNHVYLYLTFLCRLSQTCRQPTSAFRSWEKSYRRRTTLCWNLSPRRSAHQWV